jgi:hypothetical protein
MGAFAEQVAKCAPVNKLKAADGERMSDLYLRDKLATRHAWVPAVYKETKRLPPLLAPPHRRRHRDRR